MKTNQKLGYKVEEMLTQLSLELEASALAARSAALSAADEATFWANLQQMYARLNQANYFVDCFKSLFDSFSKTDDEASPP